MTRILAALVLVAFIAGSIWLGVAGPCGMWKFAPSRDVPARCLHHFTGGAP